MAVSTAPKITLLAFVGLLMLLMGILSYAMFPRILKWQVEENLILTPSAEPYEYWREVPVPIYIEFYFFNVTNSDDIINNHAMPKLQELGPYTFRETREKVNITWHSNGTVSYFQIKRWFFESNLTVGSLDDKITSVNVPLANAVQRGIRSGDNFFLDGINTILEITKSTLFVTRSVRKLLFEGYEEMIIELAQNIGINTPYDKFGWYYSKNNSDDGEYTIFTGQSDVRKYGYVNMWNGHSIMSNKNSPCDVIDGTAGDMWPPFRYDKKEKLSLFVPDICSTLKLNYLSDVEVNEIESYRYCLDETAFDNGKYEEKNSCQCVDSCLPPGVLDIEKCQQGTPAVVSFPHFLYADPKYSQKLSGLKPDADQHMFLIDLEPKLGIPVNVKARLQINVAIPQCDDINAVDLPNETIYYPIFWFSETASINLEAAEKLKFVTKMLPQYVTIGCFLSTACGVIILIFVVHIVIRQHRRKPKKSMMYNAVCVIHQENFE